MGVLREHRLRKINGYANQGVMRWIAAATCWLGKRIRLLLLFLCRGEVMIKLHVVRTVLGSVMVVSGVLYFPTAQADLSQDILEGIANGTRVNTKVQAPLSAVKVPEPSNLDDFVKNKQAAIALGKALFWDMQVGSDGVQACASCHFSAGADNRAKNELNPGLNRSNQDATGNRDTTFEPGTGPNYHLRAVDFPMHVLSDRTLFTTATLTDSNGVDTVFPTQVLRDGNDVVSSQGVAYSVFGSDVPQADPDGPVLIDTEREAVGAEEADEEVDVGLG